MSTAPGNPSLTATLPVAMPSLPGPSFASTGRSRLKGDLILRAAAAGGGLLVLLMLASLIAVLTHAAMPSLKQFGTRFLTTSDWRPNPVEQPRRDATGKIVYDADGEPVTDTLDPAFGALPVIYGTVVSSAIALAVAVPVSLGTAVFLVRIAPGKLIAPVSFLVEFLAAIPSIAYGIWGLFVMAPFLQNHLEPALRALLGHLPGTGWMFTETTKVGTAWQARQIPFTGRDMLCGGLVLAVMILPIITAIARDVLRQVPRAQVEGTVALGATWWQSTKEMLKYSRAGLFGAVMLGLARAAGETMAITMVIGNNAQIKASPLQPAQTMSSLLANQFVEASTELQRAALCEVALILLVMSLLFNIVARWLIVGKGDSRGARGA